MTDQACIIKEAFLLGFMASREGFNAESFYSHCAPLELEPFHETIEEMRSKTNLSKAFNKLQSQAIELLTKEIHERTT
jgi:hypothetical protein